jgi:hypothetical protein
MMMKLAGLLAAAALSSVYPLCASGPPVGTTSITFNGFCDGATVTYVSGVFLSGTHDNWDCNGGETFLAGGLGQDFLLLPNLVPSVRANLADNVGMLALNGCAVELYLDFSNSGWALYDECSGATAETLVNFGKFTITGSGSDAKAKPHIGGVASWQRMGAEAAAPAAAATNPYPQGPYTLTLSGGVCYSFSTVTAGLVRAGGTVVTGNCTGLNPVPFAANYSSIGGDPTLIVTYNGSELSGSGPDLLVVYFFDFTNFTFTAYVAENSSGLMPLNSGTFTLTGVGAP